MVVAVCGNNPMNTFLVVTGYQRFSMEGSTAMEAFQQWIHNTICTEPYIVLVTAPLAMDDFIREMKRLDVKCRVTELGKTVEVMTVLEK